MLERMAGKVLVGLALESASKSTWELEAGMEVKQETLRNGSVRNFEYFASFSHLVNS